MTTYLLAWPKSMALTAPNVTEDRAIQILIHCKWECNMVKACWKMVWQFPILKIFIYDSAVAFLDTYPNKLKACSSKSLHMFSYSSVYKPGSNQGVS